MNFEQKVQNFENRFAENEREKVEKSKKNMKDELEALRADASSPFQKSLLDLIEKSFETAAAACHFGINANIRADKALKTAKKAKDAAK